MSAQLLPRRTEILPLVWRLQPAAVQEIYDSVPKDRSIAYATVQTLLRRLEKKGYVRHDVQGKAHLFSAAVKGEQVIKRTAGDFAERLFGGDPLPLMLHLADQSNFNADDFDELKKLIERSLTTIEAEPPRQCVPRLEPWNEALCDKTIWRTSVRWSAICFCRSSFCRHSPSTEVRHLK